MVMKMVAHVTSVAPIGFDASLIEVECDGKTGLPSVQIVGMGNKAIDEAKERVRSAISNSLLEFPKQKLTINLAPAELPKDGAHFDLPIAVAILAQSGQLRQHEINGAIFAGELALDGSLRPIKGSINIVEAARAAGYTTVYLPMANTQQAHLITGIDIIGVSSLKELFLHLKREQILQPSSDKQSLDIRQLPASHPVLDDIYGQETAKRAIVIATAGRHNILMNGSPGAGKTLLAKTILSLLPSLTLDEQIAVTKLHSIAGEADSDIISQRPFRSPHHTSSRIAITGGGTRPKPGEISLAHLGVLFLDEIPEYARSTLETLRQPLEDHTISLARANGRITYPADFMLVATMNPCPCGYYGDTTRACQCAPTQVINYQKRLSGPLLDRIDMAMTIVRTDSTKLLEQREESKKQHDTALKSIEKAQKAQALRYRSSTKYNSTLTSRDIARFIKLDPTARHFLEQAATKLNLSTRAYFKVIKVAQTIADLENTPRILQTHIGEALQYRHFSAE